MIQNHSLPMESPTQAFNLTNKLVLVTGSTLGIGKSAAERFIGAGATVLINGRKQATVDACVDELNAKKGTHGLAVAAPADTATLDGIQTLLDIVKAQGRPLDVLVHNVGIYGVADFFELPDEEWEHIFNVNVMSTVRICRAFLKDMLNRDRGRVVIVSSECGIRGFATMPHYAMTKAAQLSLVRSLAGLTRGTSVRVNAVVPGPTWTEGVAKYMEGVAKNNKTSVDDAIRDYFMKDEPGSLIERYLKSEEIGNAIVFLGSDASAGMSGTALRVEGGMLQAV